MTLGENIQALRKRAGLSQEALGEHLGVTRQSISKWESDQTTPELDKLIAMSRRFGVTIGFLLQVEAEDSQAGSSSTEGELTERELAAAERIAEQYIAALHQTQRSSRRRWPFVLLALVAAVWVYTQIDRLRIDVDLLQNSISYVQRDINSQMSYLPQRIEEILAQQNHVTAAFSYEVEEIDLLANTLTFHISATPRQFQEGMTAQFLASGLDMKTVEVPAQADGRSFYAQLTCPIADDITLSVAFSLADEVQTQVLGVESGWRFQTQPEVVIAAHSIDPPSSDGVHSFTEPLFLYYMPTEVKSRAGLLTIVPEQVTMHIYHNEQQVATLPIDMGTTIDMTVEMEGGTELFGTPMNLHLKLDIGDKVAFVAEVTDNFGRVSWVLADLYQLNSNQQLDYPDYTSSDVLAALGH